MLTIPSGYRWSICALIVLSYLQVAWLDLCKQQLPQGKCSVLQSGELGLLTAVNGGEAEVLRVPWAPGTFCRCQGFLWFPLPLGRLLGGCGEDEVRTDMAAAGFSSFLLQSPQESSTL